jgi:hypothetical protein
MVRGFDREEREEEQKQVTGILSGEGAMYSLAACRMHGFFAAPGMTDYWGMSASLPGLTLLRSQQS